MKDNDILKVVKNIIDHANINPIRGVVNNGQKPLYRLLTMAKMTGAKGKSKPLPFSPVLRHYAEACDSPRLTLRRFLTSLCHTEMEVRKELEATGAA